MQNCDVAVCAGCGREAEGAVVMSKVCVALRECTLPYYKIEWELRNEHEIHRKEQIHGTE